MNNLKRKYNIYSSACPRMNWAVHGNDRWRLLLRLQRTRRLYRVLVDEEDIECHFFFEYAFSEEDIYRKYDYLSIVKVEEIKK